MDDLSDEARALLNLVWRAALWRALRAAQADTFARPDQLVNLADVIRIMTNKPSVWDDPRNEITDWAINHLIDYSFDIQAVLHTYPWAETVNLAAAVAATAGAICAALQKHYVGNKRRAILALVLTTEFYDLV